MISLCRFMNMGCIVKAALGQSSPLYHLTSEPAASRDLESICLKLHEEGRTRSLFTQQSCMAINVLSENSDNFFHYCRYLVIIKECCSLI